jgi:hypothetical protein
MTGRLRHDRRRLHSIGNHALGRAMGWAAVTAQASAIHRDRGRASVWVAVIDLDLIGQVRIVLARIALPRIGRPAHARRRRGHLASAPAATAGAAAIGTMMTVTIREKVKGKAATNA